MDRRIPYSIRKHPPGPAREEAIVAATRAWAREEFARRTEAVETGTAPIGWLDPGSRVGFSECVAKAETLGSTLSLPDLRSALGSLD